MQTLPTELKQMPYLLILCLICSYAYCQPTDRPQALCDTSEDDPLIFDCDTILNSLQDNQTSTDLTDLDKALLEAAKQGRIDQLENLINQGASLYARIYLGEETLGHTILHIGALTNNLAIVKKAIELGVHINTQIFNGNTALHMAASRGYRGIVQFLLKENASTHIGNTAHATALHLAIYFEHPQVVELLLKSNPPLDAEDIHGLTPKSLADMRSHTEITKLIEDYLKERPQEPHNSSSIPIKIIRDYKGANA